MKGLFTSVCWRHERIIPARFAVCCPYKIVFSIKLISTTQKYVFAYQYEKKLYFNESNVGRNCSWKLQPGCIQVAASRLMKGINCRYSPPSQTLESSCEHSPIPILF